MTKIALRYLLLRVKMNKFIQNMSINPVLYSLPPQIEDAVKEQIGSWESDKKIHRIWANDATVWTGDDEAGWLGWLIIVEREIGETQKYKYFHTDI